MSKLTNIRRTLASAVQMPPQLMTLMLAFAAVVGEAQALPSTSVQYNPPSITISGNQPLVPGNPAVPTNPYTLTITSPTGVSYPITIDLAFSVLKKPSGVSDAVALSFVSASPKQLTFTSADQALTTDIAVSVPLGDYAGDYAWNVKGATASGNGWPTGVYDPGCTINSEVEPPLADTSIKPVAAISRPKDGDIFKYLGGDPVSFSIDYSATVADGGQPLTSLQLFFDQAPLTPAQAPVLGTSSATASATSPGLTDGGRHAIRVTAQNNSGADTKIIYINVHTPPRIVTPPASQAVYVGGTAVLSVIASGTPAPTYQWFKDGVLIPGATGAALQIAGASEAEAGNYHVVAENDLGSATSDPAKLTIARQTQRIVFPAPAATSYGAPSFTLGATATSGLPVGYISSNPGVANVNGSTVTVLAVGTTTLTASQAGNEMYLAAEPVSQTLTVNKAPLIVTADNKSRVYGTNNPPFTITYSGFVLNEGPTALLTQPTAGSIASPSSDAGTHEIVVSGGSSNNYALTCVNGTLTIRKADQTIAFDPLAEKLIGAPPFVLEAAASSNLPVRYQSSSPSIASVQPSNGTVTIHAAGSTLITAFQDGNTNYNPAPAVTQELKVRSLNATLAGVVFLDAKADGVFEPAAGEIGLTGITVEFRNGSNAVIAWATTDSNGRYTMSVPGSTPQGTYHLIVGVPTGLRGSTPTEFSRTFDGGDIRGMETGLALNFAQIGRMRANGFTIGYWSSNIEKALNGKTNGVQVSASTLEQHRVLIADPAFLLAPFSRLELAGADDILTANTSDASELLAKQLLAAEFNYANGAYLDGNQTLTKLFLHWGEYIRANPAAFSPAYTIWAKDWFDAYNNSHGDFVKGPQSP